MAVVTGLALGLPGPQGELVATRASAAPPTQSYIVVLKDGTDPDVAARKYGVTPSAVYGSALSGYAAALSQQQVKRIASDPSTDYVDADRATFKIRPDPMTVEPPQPAQVPSFATRRVGGLESRTAKIDGVDERVDVDVAVIDSGVDPHHPDLNVVGGKSCAPRRGFDDVFGHGTMVGGFIGALDNSIGRVGVAPGARLWAIRVADGTDSIPDSRILCAVDWVTRHADIIDVANMSLSDFGQFLPCPQRRRNALHAAICKSVDAGVTYVVAAGNESVDAAAEVPSGFPEVITVSAIADTDGKPGGLGPRSDCLPDDVPREMDDTFAFFSNFGSVVDLAAPGLCIGSTFPGGLYGSGTGTSFATPIVAGAAALYLARHPDATPAKVRSALIARRERVSFPDDPDGIAEGVVNVAGL